MHDISIDPVRKARRLSELARRERDRGRLVEFADALRLLGRSDLSIEILGSFVSKFDSSKEAAIEKVRCLDALGYFTDALEIVAGLKKIRPAVFDVLHLELKLALRLGGGYLATFKYGELIESVQDVNDLRTLLEILPLDRLPLGDLLKLLPRCFQFQGARGLIVLARYAWSNLTRVGAGLFANACLWGCRILAFKRNIYVASMGKFTRLADLVDRVDPLIRRLKSDPKTASYKLFIFFFGGYPNRQLFDMYGRHCVFLPATNRVSRKLALSFMELLRLAGRFTEITTDYRKNNQDFLKSPPVISFSSHEARELRKRMEGAGIDPAKPFICFGLRDMAYYEYYGDVMKIPLAQQGKRSSTHHRCPPLATYVRFAQFWAERGYQVVRMGLKVSEALPKDLDPRIIDYASKDRSDELDAFLFSQCWFLTAGDTGLFSGAAAFDRPTLVSDLFLIRNTIYSSNKMARSIFVPKLIRDTREDRCLTFREQIHFNHFFSFDEDCKASGFEIVHNSPEDVIDASLELVDRLAGNSDTSKEDVELQKAFHSIYPSGYVGYGSTGMVSTKFLKKYSYLLG